MKPCAKQKGGSHLLKKTKLFFLLVVLIGIAVPFRLLWKQSQKTDADHKPAPTYRYPIPRHDIGGFQYVGNHGDKKVIAITADRLKIEKKKVGLFRFGMLSVARLNNAKIQIYTDGMQKKDQASESLREIFSNKTLPALPIKNVSTIEMKPVIIEIYDEKNIISAISAGSAVVRLAKQDILFKGNVTITSGFRTITTDELCLVPDKGLYYFNRPYKLKAGNDYEEGIHLTTDLWLNPIKRQQKKLSIAHP